MLVLTFAVPLSKRAVLLSVASFLLLSVTLPACSSVPNASPAPESPTATAMTVEEGNDWTLSALRAFYSGFVAKSRQEPSRDMEEVLRSTASEMLFTTPAGKAVHVKLLRDTAKAGGGGSDVLAFHFSLRPEGAGDTVALASEAPSGACALLTGTAEGVSQAWIDTEPASLCSGTLAFAGPSELSVVLYGP